MSTPKFSMFSRSALASLAASVGLGGIAAADAASTVDDDPEAGPAPADEPEGENEPGDAGAETVADQAAAAAASGSGTVEVVPVADALAVATDQHAAGRKAERDRTAAVLGSDIGKANPSMAAWMLSSNADASADAIVAQLKTMPAQSAAAPAATIPDTNVDLGSAAGAAAALNDGADDSGTVWDKVEGRAPAAAVVVGSDAGALARSAIAQGARTVSINSAAPAAPAVRPTGN